MLPAHLQQSHLYIHGIIVNNMDIVDILVQQDALVEGYKKYCLLTEVSTNLGEVWSHFADHPASLRSQEQGCPTDMF